MHEVPTDRQGEDREGRVAAAVSPVLLLTPQASQKEARTRRISRTKCIDQLDVKT